MISLKAIYLLQLIQNRCILFALNYIWQIGVSFSLIYEYVVATPTGEDEKKNPFDMRVGEGAGRLNFFTCPYFFNCKKVKNYL